LGSHRKSVEASQALQGVNCFYEKVSFTLLYYFLYKTVFAFSQPVDVPTYSFVTHSRVPETVTRLFSVDVVLFEGILSFWEESVRDLFDMKIFVDTEDDIRLIRRLKRDTMNRGRSVER
jgi:uridine kinase